MVNQSLTTASKNRNQYIESKRSLYDGALLACSVIKRDERKELAVTKSACRVSKSSALRISGSPGDAVTLGRPGALFWSRMRLSRRVACPTSSTIRVCRVAYTLPTPTDTQTTRQTDTNEEMEREGTGEGEIMTIINTRTIK
jgi:hypothetical protein